MLLPEAANAGSIPPSPVTFFVGYQGTYRFDPGDIGGIAATMLRELTPEDRGVLLRATSCAVSAGTNYAGELLAVFVCAPD